MMKNIKCFAWIFLALQLQACTTTVKVVNSGGQARLTALVTGVAIPVDFKSDSIYAGTEGCSLTLVPSQETKNFEIPFKPGKDVVFAELPPGVYHYKEIACGHHPLDLAFEQIPAVTVYDGKISVAAGIRIYIDANKKMAFKMNGRSESYIATENVIKKIGEGRQADLTSAYTGDPLVASALEAKPHHVWEVKTAQGAPLKIQFPSFKNCYRQEYAVNPLWLGQLIANASYKDGKFKNVTMDKGGSVYSDHFLECVKTTLSEFHPSQKVALRYNLGL